MKGVTFLQQTNPTAYEFQSTPPVKGVTEQALEVLAAASFQSTPPVKGVTWFAQLSADFGGLFQSTPPVKGVTLACLDVIHQRQISIHTPCEGGD